MCHLLPRQQTLLYTFFIRKKAFTPSQKGVFRLIFIAFRCEGFVLQAFTAQRNVHTAYLLIMRRFSGVKACSFNPSQVFTAGVNASEVSVNASEVSVNASGTV